MKKFLAIMRAAPEAIRHEDRDGKDHLVVPVVALVEGVLFPSNAPTPELALASEFGKEPASWDGRPVLIDHPKTESGTPISANSPEVWDDKVVGQMFNTVLDGKKLKTEAWIDVEKAESLGFADDLARLESGATVEVSTGAFVETDDRAGTFDGDDFIGVWSDVKPDHLAILPEGVIGACSVEDGCGAPRVNSDGKPTPVSCGPGCSNCPRLQADDKEVRVNERRSLFERFMERFSAKKRSDIDTRLAIEAALSNGGEDFFFINAVFESDFVFERGWSGDMFRQDFAIGEDGAVSLGDTVTHVRPETEFVDVKANSEKEAAMDIKAKVDGLIANSATKFTKEDETWLLDLSEDQLDKLEVEQPQPEPTQEPAAAESDEGSEAEADGDKVEALPLAASANTPDEYIGQAPAEMQEVLADGLRLHREKREFLIQGLKANSRNRFTDEQLEGFPTATLESMSHLSGQDDYSGSAGGPSLVVNNEDDKQPAPMPSLSAGIKAARVK